jgi:putative transposase
VVTKDEYLINCINYIEYNPIRAGMVATASEYKYSSYRERVLGIQDRASMLDGLCIDW